MSFNECLDLVLKSEGGWTGVTGLAGDSGGETNLGVTKRVWEEWLGHPVKTLKNLTKDDVAPLYELKYWRPCYCELLPRGLDFVVFSMGVNAGPGRSVKLLQSAIGCMPDGIIGSRTRGLISSSNGADIIKKFSDARREYYKSLGKPMFEKGWLNRCNREEQEALQMAKNS